MTFRFHFHDCVDVCVFKMDQQVVGCGKDESKRNTKGVYVMNQRRSVDIRGRQGVDRRLDQQKEAGVHRQEAEPMSKEEFRLQV